MDKLLISSKEYLKGNKIMLYSGNYYERDKFDGVEGVEVGQSCSG